MCACVYKCVSVCMYIRLYVCVCVCVCMYVYTLVCVRVCQVKSTLFMWHISYSRQQPQCAPHKPCVGAGLSYCTLGALCVCVGVCVVVHMLCQPSRCEGIKGARRPPPRCHLLLLGERGNKTRRHTHTQYTHSTHTHQPSVSQTRVAPEQVLMSRASRC